MTKPYVSPIDKVGLAITDAGYKWTPKMKSAYQDSIREREQLIENITMMFDALVEANKAAYRIKSDAMNCANISGDAYMKVRAFKADGVTLSTRYLKGRNT